MLKTRSFILLSLLAFTGTAGAGEIEDHLLSGSKFAGEKNYKEAAREYENAVRIDPQNPDANLLLGLTLANTGDLDNAVRYSLASVQLKPSYSGYYNLGLIYANQGKYDLAVDAYEHAVVLNGKSYQAWHQLGLVYSTSLKFDKAVEAYNKVVELNPNFASAYQGLGSAYFWSGNTEAAYAQVAKLKELKLGGKAEELERWIKDKEAKKKKSTDKAAKAAEKAAKP